MQKNNFLNKFTSVLIGGALALSSSASAQTLLWGAGSSDTRIDSIGRFASSDGTLGSLGWTSSGTEPASVWHWRTSTSIQTVSMLQGPRTLNSPSVGDGYAIFNSDSLGYSTPVIAAAPQTSQMTSPLINLNGYTDSLLIVRFHTHYLDFRTEEQDLQFSTDSGATWTSFGILNATGRAGDGEFYNNFVEIPLIGVTNGVTDLSKCFIRFTFEGDSYYLIVDDVSIITGQPFTDVALGGTLPGPTYGDLASTVKVSNNYYTPSSQIDLQEYFYGARLSNRGTNNLYIPANIRININIDFDQAGTWTNVYSSSTTVDTLEVGDSDYFADTMMWTPSNVGRYRVTYTVSALNDNNPANDSSVQFFEISQNYFSKVPVNPTTGFPTATGGILPARDPNANLLGFEYGSMFYIPRGRTPNRLALDSVSYGLFVSQSTSSTLTSLPVTIRVYKFTDRNNDGLSTAAPNSELQLLGLGIDSCPVNRGQYVFRKVPIFDLADPDSQLILLDTSIYLVTVDQVNTTSSFVTGTAAAPTYFAGFVASYDEENYMINAFISNVLPSPSRSETRVGTAAATQTWSPLAFGGNLLPSIGFTLNTPRVAPPISVNETQAAAHNMSIFPNPNKGILNLNIDLGENTPNAIYTITDAAGRVVQNVVRNNIQAEVYTFNVESLPAGVYYLSVQTKKGTSTQSFIKQ